MSSRRPDERITVSRLTYLRVGPNLKPLLPDAFVATLPPTKEVCSVGSGAYMKLRSVAAFFNAATVTAGCTIAMAPAAEISLISIMRFRASRESTVPPNGTRPPVTPVPPPETVTGVRLADDSARNFATSSESAGITTACAFPPNNPEASSKYD